MSTPLFVSCDWDFFVYDGALDQVVARHPETGEWEKIPGILLFDWGQGEGLSAGFQYIQWQNRMEHFDKVGLKIEEVATIRVDAGCTHPLQFAKELEQRVDLSGCATLFSDSHSCAHNAAALAFARAGGPMDLLLFDAHHDLGYSADRVARNEDEQVMDCGDWAYHTLASGMFRKIQVVYPDWKGTREWPKILKGSHLRDVRDRVACTTWSKWCQSTEGSKIKRASGFHVARSGGWTPPYLDRAFNQFVENIGTKPLICMDCDPEFPSIGPWNACQERRWFR